MNIILWIIFGAIAGWIASIVMGRNAQMGALANIVVGIVGALLGGWLLSPLLGAGSINQADFSLLGLLVSFGGAVLLLLIVNLVRVGRAR